MRVERASEDGRVYLQASRADREVLEEEGLAWVEYPEDGGAVLETRIWYLPAIREAVPELEMDDAVRATVAAASRVLAAPPPDTPGEPPDLGLALPGYQGLGVAFLESRTGAVLADDVGLGKTVQAATAFLRSVRAGGAALVTTEAAKKGDWRDDVSRTWLGDERFLSGEATPFPVLAAGGERRHRLPAYEAWARDGGVLIVNHDLIRNDLGLLERAAIARGRVASGPLCFSIDEARVIRSPDSKTWVAASRLGRIFDRRWALTATPIENGLADLWSLCEWARPGYLGPLETFERRHVIARTIVPRGRPWLRWRKVEGFRKLREVRFAFRAVYLRRTQRDPEVEVELPELLPPDVRVLDMEPRQAAAYRASKKNGKASLARLRLICNAPTTAGEPGGSPKLEELYRIAAEIASREKLVVFTESRRFALLIGARLENWRPALLVGGMGDDAREHAKRSFLLDPTVRVLVSTSTGYRGLNLQTAASCVVNADLPWNPAALRQRIGRVYRPFGPHRRVRVVFLAMRGTVEDKVVRRVAGKQELSDFILGGADEVSGALRTAASEVLEDA